jgi:hypothetical protein
MKGRFFCVLMAMQAMNMDAVSRALIPEMT